MASEREDFFLTGPLHLTDVDWKNDDHRRSIAACLVQAVYILERDRQEKRDSSQALAPPWFETFNFKLHSQLIDDADQCIFGAIFEYDKEHNNNNNNHGTPPRFVIAFRGTLTKGDALLRDLQLDLHVIKNGLHTTSRFETAIQAVRHVTATFGSSDIWLAGHSLGASMAMVAGKTKAKNGIYLESFLFNPPFLSAPIEKIKDQKVKQGIRIAGSFMAAGLAMALKNRLNIQNQNNQRSLIPSQSEDPFLALATWVPRLYVNRADHICSEYVGYFEHRNVMQGIGMGKIERLATQNSLGSLVMSAVGGKESDDPHHLIPSANLMVNLDPNDDFKQAHGIHQWWKADLQLESKVYSYK